MQTEFVRNLNCNYERILLDQKPEEKRYQYCILTRGGIRGLLPCSLRYINSSAYLYYNISSKQNIKQLYGGRSIARGWLRDFMWSFRQIEQELGRFLLDKGNILWYPEQIYQDLESNVFSFLYFPYYEGDNGFRELLNFWVEQVDYNDETLVDCVYRMYEQYEKSGDVYLQAKIFEDVERLEETQNAVRPGRVMQTPPVEQPVENIQSIQNVQMDEPADMGGRDVETTESKKGFFRIFEGKKKKDRELRESYRQSMQESMGRYAVAEETTYGEDYGQTIYIEGPVEPVKSRRELCTPEGRVLAALERPLTTIGKRKEEADVVLEDMSVSRLHARIVKEKEKYYIEDLNSTNGTFKNGLRLQPYERRELEPEDEVRVGRVIMIFR